MAFNGIDVHHHGPYKFGGPGLNLTRRFSYWGGHMGGNAIFNGYIPGNTNTVVNNFYGNYSYYGGMYNYNNFMPPRPMSRFDRFMTGIGGAFRNIAPILGGIYAFTSIFGDKKTESDESLKAQKDRYTELLAKEKDGTIDDAGKAELEQLRKDHPEWKAETEKAALQAELDKANDAKEAAEEEAAANKENAEMLELLARQGRGEALTNEEQAKLDGYLEQHPELKPNSTGNTSGAGNAGSAGSASGTSGASGTGGAGGTGKTGSKGKAGSTGKSGDTTTATNSNINVLTGEEIDKTKPYKLQMKVIRHKDLRAEAYVAAPDGKVYMNSVRALTGKIETLGNMLLEDLKNAGFKNITIVDPDHSWTSAENGKVDVSGIYKNENVDKNKHYDLTIKFARHTGGHASDTAAVCTPDGKLYTAESYFGYEKALVEDIYNQIIAAGYTDISINGKSVDGTTWTYPKSE